MPFPLLGKGGGEDYKLLQQGALQMNDKKIFMMPNINMSGASIKLGIGSPAPIEFSVLPIGVEVHSIQGVDVYKKAYIRLLNNGSFLGEYT